MLKFSSIQFSSLHSLLGAALAAAKRLISKWEVVTRFLIEPARRLINYIYDMQLDSENMHNGLGRVLWRHCDEGLASHASLTERAQAMLQEEDNEKGHPRPSSDKLKDRRANELNSSYKYPENTDTKQQIASDLFGKFQIRIEP